MKAQNNLKFEFLHRDEGNYKLFGSITLSNPKGISPAEATAVLKEKLIDREYFYPKDYGIPLFQEHTGITFFSDWYEFDQFSISEEAPTDSRTVEEFIQTFAKAEH